MVSEQVARQILELKKEAILLKKDGNTQAALAKLQAARDLEFSSIERLDDITDPAKLKQLAVYYKQQGNLEAAKQALLKSKGQVAAPSQERSSATPLQARATQSQTPSESERTKPETEESSSSKNKSADPVVASQADTAKDDDVSDEDMRLLQEELGGGLDIDTAAATFDPTAVTFTEVEMMDLEMMTEFKIGGLGAPSIDEYQCRIVQCKQKALQYKNSGDKTKALDELRKMKQLEVVLESLSQVEDGLNLKEQLDDDDWLADLNQDDHELIREMYNSESDRNMHGDGLSLEELEGLDEGALKDAMELGMEIPTVEAVRERAEEKKTLAVQLKRGGDLAGAKTALEAFKGLTQQAERLEILLENVNGTAKPITGNDLEALLAGSVPKKMQKASKPTQQAPKPKTSQELRAEAVRLRDEKKIKEATEVLKLFKLAVKREENEAELAKRQEVMSEISAEVDKAKEQIHFFDYYERLVSEKEGQVHTSRWCEYASECKKAIQTIAANGSSAVTIGRQQSSLRLMSLNDLPALIERAMDPTETRLEFAVISAEKLDENKSVQSDKTKKVEHGPSKIRVSVSVQLPLQGQESEEMVEFSFESEPIAPSVPSYIDFKSCPPKFIDVPRGNSKLAKTVLRRLERRKVQIQVSRIFERSKKKWFGRSSDPSPPCHLGKISLELNELLGAKCIAGKFPLLGGGSKATGGSLGFCIRTGMPFTTETAVSVNDGSTPQPSTPELKPYTAMTFGGPPAKES